VRVRIYKADPEESSVTWPQFNAVPAAPGTAQKIPRWQAFFAGKGEWK
jgi:sulfite dehydrogenase (quinone) subunit SoeA